MSLGRLGINFMFSIALVFFKGRSTNYRPSDASDINIFSNKEGECSLIIYCHQTLQECIAIIKLYYTGPP